MRNTYTFDEVYEALEKAMSSDLVNFPTGQDKTDFTLDMMNAFKAELELLRSNDPVCDVLGCTEPPSCGGIGWSETGYWSLCREHEMQWFKGGDQPRMKQKAIDRNNNRNK